MTNDIPEQTTIKLPSLQRSALRSLLNAAPPDYRLDDLLELVVIKGIAALVKGRELPGISDDIREKADAPLPSGSGGVKGERVSEDYVGFFITPDQDAALLEVEERFPLVDEDEVLRIVLDAGLRALPRDPVAQRRLDAVGSWRAEEEAP